MLSDLKKSLMGHQPTNADYSFLQAEDASGELVSIHCEATSYDVAKAELRVVAAVKIRGNRILTSRSLVLTLKPGEPAAPAIDRLLRFIGGRPLVGYYLDFTVSVLDKYVRPVAGIALPNPQMEVSGLYYDRKVKTIAKGQVDLRLDSVLRDLGLPDRGPTNAFNDAVAAALIYLKLQPPARS